MGRFTLLAVFTVLLVACGGGSGDGSADPANDSSPAFSIDNVTAAENSGSATFIVRLSESTQESTQVDFTTTDNTAIAGVDYVAQSGTLRFQPDETSQLIIVDIIDDDSSERLYLQAIGDMTILAAP